LTLVVPGIYNKSKEDDPVLSRIKTRGFLYPEAYTFKRRR